MHEDKTTGSEERPPIPTRWEVAVHEAAHAAYARSQALVVKFVTVEGIVAVENGGEYERGYLLGVCCYTGGKGLGKVRRCVFSLVGPAAEYRVGGVKQLLPYEEFVRDAEGYHPESDEAKVVSELRLVKRPEALYKVSRKRAEAFVADRWAEIVTLAERFMEVVSLNEEGVELVFDPSWLEFREMLDEIAREDDLIPSVRAAMREAGVEDPGDLAFGPDGGPLT